MITTGDLIIFIVLLTAEVITSMLAIYCRRKLKDFDAFQGLVTLRDAGREKVFCIFGDSTDVIHTKDTDD